MKPYYDEDGQPTFTDNQLRMLKYLCEQDNTIFFRTFFNEGFAPDINWHHLCISWALHQVEKGNITRLIVNIPPGFSKTELITVNWIARMIAKHDNPRFINCSYGREIAFENSGKIKRIISEPLFQKMWPTELLKGDDKKSKFKTSNGAQVLSESTTGQIKGFRAGRMFSKKFSGAIVVDDPNKAGVGKELELVTEGYTSILKNRLATQETPVVNVQQRLAVGDLAGAMLTGLTGEKWHHLCIPAVWTRALLEQSYEYSHGIKIDVAELRYRLTNNIECNLQDVT